MHVVSPLVSSLTAERGSHNFRRRLYTRSNLSDYQRESMFSMLDAQYFSRPGAFKPSHKHEDLHLAVGWTACLIAGGISLYGWYVPFSKSKPWIMLGVIAYVDISSDDRYGAQS